MNRKSVLTMAAALAAAVAATAVVPAFAADSVPAQKLTPATVRAEKVQKPELTEEQKAEMLEKAKAALDEKLASGEIEQEKYDEMLAKLEAGDLRGFGGKRHGRRAMEPTAETTADAGETL